jgi:hypothetical protein
MKYNKYLKTSDWKTKRFKKLSIKRRCAICGSSNKLEVHHLNYKNLIDVEQTDLRKLCHNCHFLAHRLYKKGYFKFNNTNHHSRFTILKSAVKKYLGISTINIFRDRATAASSPCKSIGELTMQSEAEATERSKLPL